MSESECEPASSSGRWLGRYDQAHLKAHFMPRAQWQPFPPASYREGWGSLLTGEVNRRRKAEVIEQAEPLRGRSWPVLTLSMYLEYARSGSRQSYQREYFHRRYRLGVLVLAECLEHRGRFLDDVADGLWTIMEESVWHFPAHQLNRNPDDPLPSPGNPLVDLFASETAFLLAETLYLLGSELDEQSPVIGQRVRDQVQARVIGPVESPDFAWWLSGVNNWTPWCSSSVLAAAMYLTDDMGRLIALSHKLMAAVDRFIGRYGDDGGCNEGANYWGVAAGAMLLFLELLHSRTDGAIDLYDDPRIAAMGRFIVSAHVSGPWFACFADSPPQPNIRTAVTYRFGERIGDERMMQLALLAARNWDGDAPPQPLFKTQLACGNLMHAMRELFWVPADRRPTPMRHHHSDWLADLQLLVARQHEDSRTGLALTVIGGHNQTSHNHLDVGHVAVYLDGRPMIIDVGVGEYTRQTFSPLRYEQWEIGPIGHNPPMINGHGQGVGRTYAATRTRCQESADGCRLSLNLEAAYPPEAGLTSLRRVVRFQWDAGVIELGDRYDFDVPPRDYRLHFHTPAQVTQPEDGRLVLRAGDTALALDYGSETLHASIEVIELTDAKLQQGWGPRLNRITFTLNRPPASGTYRLHLTAGANRRRNGLIESRP